MRLLGIIPAAGLGTRLSPLPFSKELYPLGYQQYEGKVRPCPVSQHLVTAMKAAGIEDVFFVINPSKTDIVSYYSSGSRFGMRFSYLIQPQQKGMVDALSIVTPWLPRNEDLLIYFGMPDTLFKPSTFFIDLTYTMIQNPDIDILLGVFPTKAWHKLGMILLKDHSDVVFPVIDIIDKPKTKPATDYAWGIAIWRTPFQQLLTTCSQNHKDKQELVLGDVFKLAKSEGMNLCCLKGEEYLDTGTIEDLHKAIQLTNQLDEMRQN